MDDLNEFSKPIHSAWARRSFEQAVQQNLL